MKDVQDIYFQYQSRLTQIFKANCEMNQDGNQFDIVRLGRNEFTELCSKFTLRAGEVFDQVC